MTNFSNLQLCLFFFFYYKYTKLDRQTYENDLIYKSKKVLDGGGLDAHAALVSKIGAETRSSRRRTDGVAGYKRQARETHDA